MDTNKESGVTKTKSLPEGLQQKDFSKKLENADVFIIQCPACGKPHFRHAGYMEVMTPFVDAKNGAMLSVDSKPVKICVSCKAAHIMVDGQIIDVTEQIDLKAWAKTEVEAQEATGPGGQC